MALNARIASSVQQWFLFLNRASMSPLSPNITMRTSVHTFGKTESQIMKENLTWELQPKDQSMLKVGLREVLDHVTALRWDVRNDGWDENADKKHHGLAICWPVGLQNPEIMAEFSSLVIASNEIATGENRNETVLMYHPKNEERKFRAPWPLLCILPNSSLAPAGPDRPGQNYDSASDFAVSMHTPVKVSDAEFDSLLVRCRESGEAPSVNMGMDVVGGAAKPFIPQTFSAGRPKGRGGGKKKKKTGVNSAARKAA